MADAIKHMYNYDSLHKLALDIASVYNEFKGDEFLQATMDDVSVRKHYPGIHSITLIVNGMGRGTLDFELHKSKT